MIEQLKSVAIFVYVVKLGSFRKAAKQLGLSPSVVSYHISSLEEYVGCSLLYRSTRSISLTSEGREFYLKAEDMLKNANEAFGAVVNKSDQPMGKLRITIPSLFIQSSLVERIAQFSQEFPLIHLDLNFSDKRENIISEAFDLAVRVGKLEDSSLKVVKLGKIERVLVGSSKLFEKIKKPKNIEDLKKSQWIGLKHLPSYRVLKSKNKTREKVEFSSTIKVNSVEAMTKFCILGQGLATPPRFLVQKHIEKGDLLEILPTWEVESIDFFVLWPPSVSKNTVVQLFVDYIKQ